MHYTLEGAGGSHNLIAEGQIQAGETQRLKDALSRAMHQPGGINEVLLNSQGATRSKVRRWDTSCENSGFQPASHPVRFA